MLTRSRRIWDVVSHRATDESVYLNRRAILAGMALSPMLAGLAHAEEAAVAGELYPAKRNQRFTLDRPLTDEALATSYNNYYEFGSHKRIAADAQALNLRPWTVTIDGLVEAPITLDAEELIRKMPLEERLYRHRCVEAWSMAVPWTGFPLRALLDLVRPLGAARYVTMTTFQDPSVAAGQKQVWYPWPYVEGLTIDEAAHELAFIGTGIYGKPMPKQNGAPLRLVCPWKYGFKSVKGIVRFELTEQRPTSFWQRIAPDEYGFWANVNPEVPHPRWSQATERPLGESGSRPTLLFNGYAEQVAGLYRGREAEPLYM
jgi:sulfoxide reductase catalytic subunit YedY